MKTEINQILTVTVLAMLLTGCGNAASASSHSTASSSEPAATAVEQEDETAKYYGIWKATEVELKGSTFTIAELEAAGDYSCSNFYFVIKEGGAVYFTDGKSKTTGKWIESPNGITIGNLELTKQDEKLTVKSNDNQFYLEKISDSQNITDIPAMVTAPAATSSAQTPVSTAAVDNNTIRPEIKNAIDSYEVFFNEYAEFMKKYSSSKNTSELLTEYTKFMTKYTEAINGLNQIGSSDLNSAELQYYTDASLRIQKVLLAAAQ